MHSLPFEGEEADSLLHFTVPLIDLNGQYIVSNSVGLTNATGYAELNSPILPSGKHSLYDDRPGIETWAAYSASGFTQVSLLIIAGFQIDANSTCFSDLYQVQVLNPVYSIDLVSVTSNTSREFLIEVPPPV